MNGAVWSNISKEAHDFVRRCLDPIPTTRITSEEALKHPWILKLKKYNKIQNFYLIDNSLLNSMRSYCLSSPLKKALSLLISYSLTSLEVGELKNLFYSLDNSGNGSICYEDFENTMSKNFENLTSSEIEFLFSNIKLSGNKEIKYSELIASVLQTHVNLTDDILKRVFQKFSSENLEYATSKQTFHVFRNVLQKEKVNEIFREYDACKTGKIDFDSFVCYIQDKTPFPMEDDKLKNISLNLNLNLDRNFLIPVGMKNYSHKNNYYEIDKKKNQKEIKYKSNLFTKTAHDVFNSKMFFFTRE